MKKLIFSVMMLCVAAVCHGQDAQKSEWLTSFDDIVIGGTMDVKLVRIAPDEAPKVVYDTKGSYTTKFSAVVKERVLHIRERTDNRRPEPTVVTVYYNDINSLTVTDAVVSFAEPVARKTWDLTLSGNADVVAEVDVKDIDAALTGHSKLTLTGTATYLTVNVSTGKFDGEALEAASVRVVAQSGGEAKVWPLDRLEGSTMTNGVIRHKGMPDLLRISRKFLAGDVRSLE